MDDGLELRKLSFQSLITLLDHTPESVNFNDCVKCFSYALTDDEEVKLLCYMLMVRLAKLGGSVVLENLPSFIDVITSDVQKSGDSSVKRNSIQALAALSLIPNSLSFSKKLEETINTLEKYGALNHFNQAKSEIQI